MKHHQLQNHFRMGVMVLALAASPVLARQALAQAHSSAPALSDYVLGPDDKVHITVYGEDRLSGDYSVASSGQISFPLIGEVSAAGHTLADVQEDICKRLAAGYLIDPHVSIEVGVFRSLYILGEVNKPGEYPYRTNLSLEQAVATAGGFTYRANQKKIAIRHLGQSEEADVKIKDSKDIALKPGDTVRVLERFF